MNTLTGLVGQFFETPISLLWILPVLLVVFIVVRMHFFKVTREDYYKKKKAKKWFFISRALIFFLLLLALATPFLSDRFLGKGDASLILLIDNSTSFSVYDQESVSSLEETLAQYARVKTIHFGDNEKTPLSDTLLEHMEKNGNLLLITDGQNNYGPNLRDALLQATTLNSTLHALDLEPVIADSAIILNGPDKVSPGVETIFTARISSTEPAKEHHVVVSLNGQTLLDEYTTETSLSFSHTFTEGNHEITATLGADDYFTENNIYYKTVRVIQKPAVLFYTTAPSPLTGLLQQLYDVTETTDLNEADKDHYYAVLVNNAPATVLDHHASVINDYLSEDNGLLIMGGEQAYDKGGYQKSKIEDILPALTAVAEEKEEGIVNIVISLDISRSVSTGYGQGTIGDVEKAIALSVVDNLKDTHQVGVIAFNTEAFIVQPLTPLKDNRELIKNKIASLTKTGESYVPSGIVAALTMAEGAGGAKNILLISDGKSGGMGRCNPNSRSLCAESLAQQIKAKGINFYGVGVGDPCIEYNPRSGNCDQWSTEIYGVNAIKKIALEAGGLYIHGQETAQRIRVIFGDPSGEESQSTFSIFVIDEDHFITQDLDVGGKVTGFNNIIPKKTAQHLITTDTGEPLLAVWRYGIGRVASLAVDDGSLWAGQLLSGEDSLFYTKTINWLIGDPEKKSSSFVYVQDTNLGRSTDVLVKGMEEPTVEGLTFYKREDDIYSATLTPSETGFHEVLGQTFAVNYNKELEALGDHDQLQNMVVTTKGVVYTSQDIDAIVAHVSTHSERPEDTKWYYDWLLVLLALLLFLLEITVRRVAEHKSI